MLIVFSNKNNSFYKKKKKTLLFISKFKLYHGGVVYNNILYVYIVYKSQKSTLNTFNLIAAIPIIADQNLVMVIFVRNYYHQLFKMYNII